MKNPLFEQIRSWLRPLEIRAQRMKIRGMEPLHFSISTLRGVWGRALNLIDREAYDTVFEGTTGPQHQPLYIIRPDLEFRSDNECELSFEWITWGDAEPFYASLLRAWDVAGGMGLGDKRVLFTVMERTPLYSGNEDRISIADIPWSLPAEEPCLLWFPHSLRLVRHGKLIRKPNLPDIIEAVFFRFSPFLAKSFQRPREAWPPFAEAVVALADMMSCSDWIGEEIMLARYSGRQKREVQQKSVFGSLQLPQGTGSLEPLFAAASALHLGKGTVMGLGRLLPKPLR